MTGSPLPILARELSWPGCDNARDLGHLPLEGGGVVRPGALLRSDGHQRLTPQGVAAVRRAGLSLIADLRLPAECDALPSPFAGTPIYRNLSVLDPGDENDAVLELIGESLPEIYRRILDRRGPRLAAVLTAIARAPGEGGVLVHCHSGKDRTGLVIALALAVAGVPAREIAADYALTAERLRPGYEDHLASIGDPARRDRGRRLFAGVVPRTMLATLAHVRERHGGAETYLRRAGMSPSALAALRFRLTLPSPTP
ncbi:tyrosine-protein phosphatase [Sphaerisporangium sp. NBC_01403]|uniref:tyrosine-protein phosphatase n=1 Tax=Sphaerisporangium sp. NBC_01403 TaxID=2903599 RepID=UPI00324383E1